MVIEETKKITKLSHSTMHSPCVDILDCQNFGISQNGKLTFFKMKYIHKTIDY
jgi:hypothetical protein